MRISPVLQKETIGQKTGIEKKWRQNVCKQTTPYDRCSMHMRMNVYSEISSCRVERITMCWTRCVEHLSCDSFASHRRLVLYDWKNYWKLYETFNLITTVCVGWSFVWYDDECCERTVSAYKVIMRRRHNNNASTLDLLFLGAFFLDWRCDEAGQVKSSEVALILTQTHIIIIIIIYIVQA